MRYAAIFFCFLAVAALVAGPGIAGTFTFVSPSTMWPSPSGAAAVPADAFADMAARVNTGFCANGNNYGAAPLPTASPTDEPAIVYVKVPNPAATNQNLVRHIRDGITACFLQSNYYTMMGNLNTNGATRLIGTNVSAYTTADIQNALTNNPSVEAMEAAPNETDVFTFPNGANLGLAITAGDTTFKTSFEYLYNDMVPGAFYSLNDANPDTFQFTSPVSNVIGNVAAPFGFSHLNHAQILQVSNWEHLYLDWPAYYSPLIRHYQPTFTILAGSLAFPKNSQLLAGTPAGPMVNAIEDHGYPSPEGYNPEGPTGDGSQSYTGGTDGICSVHNTRYSFLYNNCSAAIIAGDSNPAQYALAGAGAPPHPVWTTEYSYKVVPVGDALNNNWPDAIPDDTAVKYLLRSYFLAFKNNRQAFYWFTLMDGTDAPNGGFCTYGLIRVGGTTGCGNTDPSYPASGVMIPKAEYYAWQSMIAFFTDNGCKWPTCTFTPASVATVAFSWSNSSLPFQQTQTMEWSNNQIAKVVWLGAESYDEANQSTSPGSCHLTYSCYISVTPRSETVTVPNMTAATTYTWDTTSSDPTPTPAPSPGPTAIDGRVSINLQNCAVPAASNMFGCLTTGTVLTVSNPGTPTASVTFNVTDIPKVLVVTVNGVPVPVPTATATTNPLPASTTPGTPYP